MQDSSTSGKKPIEEVEELRPHKAKLERMSRDISERTKIAEALRESDERYRCLFEQSPIGIGLATPDGNVVSCNKAMEVITGYSVEELKKINITDTYENPEDGKALLEAMERHGSVVNFPVRKKRKDGTPYMALLNVSRVNFGDTDLFQIICIDITERKKAQEQLKQSKEFLAKMIDALDDPIFVKDQQHRWVILNDAACEVMGRPREELIGKSDCDLFPKEQADVFWERDDSVLRSGKTDVNEEEITWHGKLHTISTKKSVFTDSLSGKKFIAGSIRDITDRKRAEEALRESEERYRVLVGNIPGMVYRGKTDWSVEVISNPEKICGYSVEEFTSQKVNWAQIIHPDDRETVFDEASKIEKESVSIIQEYRIKAKDGTVRWVEDHKVSIVTDTGIFIGVDGIVFDITERKKAEEALRKSEERYRTLYDSSRDGIATANLNGTITECNQAYADMLGYSREELKKIRYQDITPSRWHAFNEKIFQEVMERGYSDVFEKEYVRKDGTVFPVSLHTWRIDEDGNPVGVGSVVRDITERKKAEEALSSALAWQEAVFEGARDAVFISDADSMFIMVNSAACKLTGFSKDELLGMRIPDLHKEEDLVAYNMYHDRIMAGEEIISEAKILRKDGTKVDTEFNNRCIKVSGTAYMHTVARDITERKKAEEALRESEEKLRTLVERANDGIVILQDELLKYVNPRTAEITGYTVEEMTNTPFDRYVAPDELPKLSEAYERRIAGEESASIYETVVRRKDGRDVHIEVNAGLVTYEGKPADLAFARDITGRKRAEERLLDYQTKLKSLASELSLTEERERRRIATELHDRISQSLVISKMNLESLRKIPQGQEFDRTLDEICNSLGQTIVDTRTLTFDLSSPILYELGFEAAVAEWLAEQIQDKYGIESEFEDDGQPKPLDDNIRLLLFRNVRELLINVVKHARAKKIKVSICKVGNEICVSVEDDGVGFDPDQAVSMAAETSGFGLFSIRQRLEQSGGSFEIKSELGRGCKVTMTAPLNKE